MKKFIQARICICTAFLISVNTMVAKEGMWIPSLLGAAYDDMQAMGLKLSEEDIYSINRASIKDAIVLFGGGCTGEFVSKDGLLFTNHHCGFDYIQYHSSVAKDYLKNGFWAMKKSDELPCPGLSVLMVHELKDITLEMRKNISSSMQQTEFDAALSANRKAVDTDLKKAYPGFVISIKTFDYGNQFIAMIMKSYDDVRLVGAPPAEIGKYGGDLDNWVWPRHTGDFSVFRVYANAKNEPAKYESGNVPFHPTHSLPIDLSGVKEGDFSMVYGFPGKTEHLLSAASTELITQRINPMRIDMRTRSLEVIDSRMKTSAEIRIKYSGKQSDVANAWKKWKGQQIGLSDYDAVEKKRKSESVFLAECQKQGQFECQAILDNLNTLVRDKGKIAAQQALFVEYLYYGPEIHAFAHRFSELVAHKDSLMEKKIEVKAICEELLPEVRLFYKNFDLPTEVSWYANLTPMFLYKYADPMNPVPVKSLFEEEVMKKYRKSFLVDSTRVVELLKNPNLSSLKKLMKDEFFVAAEKIFEDYERRIKPEYQAYQKQLDYWMMNFSKTQQAMSQNQSWADANSTLRISYGKVDGSSPVDGQTYRYFTTSQGILQKAASGEDDYSISSRMRQLLQSKNFGQYKDADGTLHTCYTGSNHTTGGNSGSPALNADGELTGINFDRSWESTMSDIMYNPDICRNIMVDIRYVLWVIDIYAGAGYLLTELDIRR
ncbi:MAG: S46 family peptidase [Flavobacteriales bacterium]